MRNASKSKVEKLWKKGLPASNEKVLHQRRGLCNCSSSVFNIKAGAFALVSKLFLLLVRYEMHLPFTLKWAITFFEEHIFKSEYLTNFDQRVQKKFAINKL